MSRRLALTAILAVAAAAAVAVALAWPPARPAVGHRPFHIGCPPGSHGKMRTDGVGRSLARARAGEGSTAATEPLADRRITAGHPRAGTAIDGGRP